MRIRWFVLTATLLVATFGCTKTVDVEAERTAIRTADTDWSATIGTMNADEFAKLVAADGKLMPPNEAMVSGTDAVRQWASRMMANPGFKASWQPTTVEVAASGDLGYSVGTYEMQMQMPDGTPMNDHGKYATIWKKQADGTWKVAVDIFNSDVPMPSASDTTQTGS
jgi:uncharacterized protein (TIGR02246 family)